jgi:hypothetical protein
MKGEPLCMLFEYMTQVCLQSNVYWTDQIDF